MRPDDLSVVAANVLIHRREPEPQTILADLVSICRIDPLRPSRKRAYEKARDGQAEEEAGHPVLPKPHDAPACAGERSAKLPVKTTSQSQPPEEFCEETFGPIYMAEIPA